MRELKDRGYRVAVVKHTHEDFDIDQPGKDTWRLAQAGGDVVAISSGRKTAVIEHSSTEMLLDEIIAPFKNRVDIVLTEGYKNGSAAKIEISRCDRGEELLCREEDLLAIVSDRRFSLKVRQFDLGDAAGVVNLLLSQVDENAPHSSRE